MSLDFPASVAPFILRGITLAGIDSVNCPRPRRVAAWAQLAKEIDLAHLEMIVEEIGLAGVISAASELIEGKRRGRIVVDVNR